MRNAFRMSLALATLLVAGSAMAQGVPTIGTVTPGACGAGGTFDILANGGELYAVKLDGNGYNDWQMDASAKGGPLIGLQPGDVGANGFQVLGNWNRTEGPSQPAFVFITFPDGRLYVDSGLLAGFNFMGEARLQTVGNTASGLTLPGGTGQYSVDLGAGAKSFPTTGGDVATMTGQGIEVAFGTIAEINNVDLGGCTWGAAIEDPGNPGFGVIIGYNLYRMADAGSTPTPAEIGTMANWQYFMPFDTFDIATADTAGTMGTNTAAPTDANAFGDLVGLQNPDGVAYSGDDVLLFQDSVVNPEQPISGNPPTVTSPRATGTPPVLDGSVEYWYAIQPVVSGNVDDFLGVGMGLNDQIFGDFAVDMDGDGTNDAVDFDAANGPEFFSPQANAGMPGLGLTNGGLPLLSPVTRSDFSTLPALGQIKLQGERSGRGLQLQLSTGLEAANVQGYNVYRTAGDERVRVNSELILARGGSGSVYTVADDGGSARRARRGGVYTVETIYNDGTVSRTDGPFEVTIERSSNRRR